MNRDEARELLPYIQAFADGKRVQQYIDGDWVDARDLEDCIALGLKLRVVHEPRNFWVVVKRGSIQVCYCHNKPMTVTPDEECIHVREVME